jgi:hypothetical protein
MDQPLQTCPNIMQKHQKFEIQQGRVVEYFKLNLWEKKRFSPPLERTSYWWRGRCVCDGRGHGEFVYLQKKKKKLIITKCEFILLVLV